MKTAQEVRYHNLINKTQEVWVNKEFEDDLDNSKSVKRKVK